MVFHLHRRKSTTPQSTIDDEETHLNAFHGVRMSSEPSDLLAREQIPHNGL